MRHLLPALLLVAGCGSVVPYSLAPDWVAPDVVPAEGASAVVVTEASATPGRTVLDGRVLDEVTGRPVAGAMVEGGAAEAVTDADGRFSLDLAPGGVALAAARDGYAPVRGALRLAPDRRTGVLVLLSPRGATDPPTEP